jgi:hypothetical protein
VNLWPEDSAEDALEMRLWQWAAMFAATGVALVTLVLAIILQTAYHGVILLWIWLGLPFLFVAKAFAHIGAALQVAAAIANELHGRAGPASGGHDLSRADPLPAVPRRRALSPGEARRIRRGAWR